MPRVDNPNAINNSMPGLLAKANRDLADIKGASRNSPFSIVVGAGGAIFNGLAQFLGGITGPFNVAGAISATTTIAAGTSLSAGTSLNVATAATIGNDVTSTSGTFWSLYALNNAVTTGYFALYVNSDGRFGRTVSARRYKQDIVNFSPSAQAVFAMQLRDYRLKAAVAELGDKAQVEHGLIAEELTAIGLDWLVLYGADGQAEGIAYEKVALALIPAIQDHERRLLVLEAR